MTEYDNIDVSEVIKTIAGQVTAKEAAERYGMRIGRNNRALCIWHNDTHPDLAFYDSYCYCHACHGGGDSVALTAQLFNLSMWDAAAKLNADFNLKMDMRAPAQPAGPSKTEIRRREHIKENREYGILCTIEREADERLDHLTKGCAEFDDLWDDPQFINTLKARSKARTALETIRAKEVVIFE